MLSAIIVYFSVYFFLNNYRTIIFLIKILKNIPLCLHFSGIKHSKINKRLERNILFHTILKNEEVSAVNVFEYAKKMEMDGIHYYQQEAERTRHPGFKKILQLLIHAEQKHYAFFDSLQKKSNPDDLIAFPVDEAKNIFQQMRKNKDEFDFDDEEVEAYRKALEIEKRSEKFYRSEAEKEENKEIKKQLLQVAEEEKKHVLLVDGMVEYINRPNAWVEHAMFSQPRPEY